MRLFRTLAVFDIGTDWNRPKTAFNDALPRRRIFMRGTTASRSASCSLPSASPPGDAAGLLDLDWIGVVYSSGIDYRPASNGRRRGGSPDISELSDWSST